MQVPQPITNTDVYLAAVLNALIELNERFARVENELQQFNAATQSTRKPTVQVTVDASKVGEIVNQRIDQIIRENKVKPKG